VAIIATILAGSAAIYFFVVLPSFQSTGTPSLFEKTITETLPFGCAPPPPDANFTQTTSNSTTTNQSPNVWGPLFGNFSAMTVERFSYSTSGNSADVSSFTVLSENSTSSGAIYEVGVKQLQNQSNSPINPTTNYSSVFLVSTNGSIFSPTTGLNESPQAAEFSFLFSMTDFEELISYANFSSKDASIINATTVKIGEAALKVTNYRHSSLVIVQTPCASLGTTTETISNWTFQTAKILGTNYTLITEMTQHYLIQSNTTVTSSSPQSFSITWKVTSFIPE
jgi:hypothetical protein